MAPFITVLALGFTIAGLVLVCFYAPCLWDYAVSVKSEARGRRRGQRTDLATVSADAAALRDTDQRRGIVNPLVPPDYTEEDELAGESGGQPVMAAVPAHQRQQRRGRRQHSSCYMLSAGQLRIEGEPPPAYSAPQWCRQPVPTDSAEPSGPAWRTELDAALWLLQQTGWRPPAAAAAAGEPPPEYTETARPTAPVEDGASASSRQQQQGRHPADTERSRRPLKPRQFQQRWERLAAELHQPTHSAGPPPSWQCDGSCPAVFPLGGVSPSPSVMAQ